MENVLLAFAANPLYYIGVVFAVCAAIGVIVVFWGFSSGIGNVFHMRGHDDHLAHARVRIINGLYICMVVFGLWEIIRVIAGQMPSSTLILSLILLMPLWIPWLYGLATGKSGGGGGH